MKVIDLLQGTPEWLKWRSNGIGSSDIAAIMGLSPWNTALDVYHLKTGLSQDKPINSAMMRGMAYEPYVRKRFEDETGDQYVPICCTHDTIDYAIASLDGYCFRNKCFVEIKVPNKHVMKLASEGKIPMHYEVQIQWQFLVTGCERGYFCSYSPADEEFIQFEVKRNPKIIHELFEQSHRFWMETLNGIPPKSQKKDSMRVDLPEFELWAAAYKDCKKTLDWNENLLKDLKDKLIKYAPDMGSFEGGGLKISRCSPRAGYDFELMKKDGIDLERYRKKVSPQEKNFSIYITPEKKP